MEHQFISYAAQCNQVYCDLQTNVWHTILYKRTLPWYICNFGLKNSVADISSMDMRNKARMPPKTAMAEQLFSYSREIMFLGLMLLLVFLPEETILGFKLR